MTDFHQTGIITTLHQLGKPSLDRLEAELFGFSKTRPIALVLPALYRMLHREEDVAVPVAS